MRNAKSLVAVVVAVLGFFSLALASVVIVDFKAEPGHDKVTLKWRVRAERNVRAYEVQRSVSRDAAFTRVGRVDAEGPFSVDTVHEYTYVDKSVFKTTGQTYYYRLKILENNGTFSFSSVVSVTPQISSARHTWGSIKAMFR